jgi:hypothetical protein
MSLEAFLEVLRSVSDGALVATYRAWRNDRPQLTAAMVAWARTREVVDVKALLAFWEAT